MFQSSPGLLAGRYVGNALQQHGFTWFQSSPGLLAGRVLAFWPPEHGACRVSILARPFGRALRRLCRQPRIRCCCFNPRPAFWPGATAPPLALKRIRTMFQSSPGLLAGRDGRDGRDHGQAGHVSILARPFGRALPRRRASRGHADRVSILARPFGRARTMTQEIQSLEDRVSILARPFGRALRFGWHGAWSHQHSFNPRPAFWPGATLGPTGALAAVDVSILARPFGRALRHATVAERQKENVSILARPFGRALPHRPPLPGRRLPVSILARPFGRALTTRALPLSYPGGMFQSSPGLLAGRYWPPWPQS